MGGAKECASIFHDTPVISCILPITLHRTPPYNFYIRRPSEEYSIYDVTNNMVAPTKLELSNVYQEGCNTQVFQSHSTLIDYISPYILLRYSLIFVDLRATGRVMCMCNKNSRAREIKQMCRAHNSHTHKDSSKAQRPTHSPSNRRLFLGRSLCQGTRKSRGHTQNNNRSTLCKWVELREECAALCQYSCLLPCRFNRIPRISFRYSPSYTKRTVAPLIK